LLEPALVDPGLEDLKTDPVLGSLRDEARFRPFERELEVPS
jgi:hypothetical protein